MNSARIERGRAARAALEAEQERIAAVAELELVLGAEPGSAPDIAFGLEDETRATERTLEELVADAQAPYEPSASRTLRAKGRSGRPRRSSSGPTWTMRPASITAARGASAWASRGSCVT